MADATKESVKVVAISAYCWGSGQSLKEAIKNCRKNASVYSTGSDIYGYAFGEESVFDGVTERGALLYRGTPPGELGVVGKISQRRG